MRSSFPPLSLIVGLSLATTFVACKPSSGAAADAGCSDGSDAACDDARVVATDARTEDSAIDDASSEGGCGAGPDDPCGVACVDILMPAVPNCGGTTVPASSVPLGVYVPEAWRKSGGTMSDGKGNVGTFDVGSCTFTFTHPCNETWTMNLKTNTCQADVYGTGGNGECLFSCPATCSFRRN